MERNVTRKAMNEKAISIINLGNAPYKAVCTCGCGVALATSDQEFVYWNATRQPIKYAFIKHITDHKATVETVGNKSSQSLNYRMHTTISAHNIKALEYVCEWEYFNVKSHGTMVNVDSVLVINYSAMNKFYSGLIAKDNSSRSITLTFENGIIVTTKIATVNDAIEIVNKLEKCKKESTYNKLMSELLEIATVK